MYSRAANSTVARRLARASAADFGTSGPEA
jgi:hypothetical protein